jgi:hypothetical protein
VNWSPGYVNIPYLNIIYIPRLAVARKAMVSRISSTEIEPTMKIRRKSVRDVRPSVA